MKKFDEKASVHQIRFRQSDGTPYSNWETKPLKDLATLATAKNRSAQIKRVLTNSAAQGIVDQRDYFEKDIADSNNLEGYLIVNDGDYVYNPRVSNIAPVGPISKNSIGQGVMSPLYTVFRFYSHRNDFFEHYFKSNHWYKYLRSVSNTGARFDRMAISPSVFMQMPVPFPSIEEQQKIADCLSSLDSLITAHTQKLDALKAHKKGLLQQLFPAEGDASTGSAVPRLRFAEFQDSGEWEEKKLGEITTYFKGFAFQSKDYTPFGRRVIRVSDMGFDHIKDDGSAIYIHQDNAHQYDKWKLQKEDLIITTVGSKPPVYDSLVGRCIVVKREQEGTLLNQNAVALRGRKGILQSFLNTLFKRKEYINFIKSIIRGNANQGSITLEDLFQYKVLFPQPNEQQKIASCLSSVDDLITAQTERLVQLKLHKKGLMQALFPRLSDED